MREELFKLGIHQIVTIDKCYYGLARKLKISNWKSLALHEKTIRKPGTGLTHHASHKTLINRKSNGKREWSIRTATATTARGSTCASWMLTVCLTSPLGSSNSSGNLKHPLSPLHLWGIKGWMAPDNLPKLKTQGRVGICYHRVYYQATPQLSLPKYATQSNFKEGIKIYEIQS